MPDAIKAVGYIRVSTEDQAHEGVSLANQKARIQAYAAFKGYELLDVLEDAGLSGKTLKRPGAQAVLRLAQSRAIDAVIVLKLDRMFRSTIDALETTRSFDKWGTSFHSIQETIDTESATGKFFFTLMAALAEMERDVISERTRAALKHKRRNGEKTGGDVPFGFQTANGALLEDRAEQKVIRLIARLKDRGHSLRAIGGELQRRGHRTKSGKTTWNPKTVAAILGRAEA